MDRFTIRGKNGKPARYAYIDKERLHFQFEYYGSGEMGDCEVIQSVSPEDYSSIAEKFGLSPNDDIFVTLKEISGIGRGEELVDALNKQVIKNEKFVWIS